MSFPTTPILDDFQATENPLSHGGDWNHLLDATNNDDAQCDAGVAWSAGGFVGPSMYWSTSTWDDVECYYTSWPNTAFTHRVCVRISNPGASWSGYYISFGGGGACNLFRMDGGTGTQLGSSGVTWGHVAGDQIGAGMVGDTIDSYVNGVSTNSRVDSNYVDGFIGFSTNATDSAHGIGNFGGGLIAGGGGPAPPLLGQPPKTHARFGPF